MARHEKFNLENLTMLDRGKIPLVFDQEAARVVKDCEERPLLDKPRRVVIVFEFIPVVDKKALGGGQVIDCSSVEVECEVQSSIPKHKTQVYKMVPKQDGSLFFHPDDPEDPEADHLYDEDSEKRDHGKKK
jgi:hypothetical protein